MSEPMSEERLQEIRHRAAASQSLGYGITWYREDTQTLIIEIDRLKAELEKELSRKRKYCCNTGELEHLPICLCDGLEDNP